MFFLMSICPSKLVWLGSIRRCKSMEKLKKMHARIITIGIHQNKDILSKLTVFCTDPSAGNLHYAERICRTTLHPFLFMYNVLIKSFAKKGDSNKVVSLFKKTREEGLLPDNYTYPLVLKAIGCLKKVSEGEKIHGNIVKTGLEFENYICNSLLEMYSELGKVPIVANLFEQIPEKDIICWNVWISCCVKWKRYEEAIDIFMRILQETNLKPVEATVVSTLSASSALKNLELGKQIHRYVSDELGFTVRISNALLDMYAKCGCVKLAREIFDQIPVKNVICWTSMITGYLNANRLEDARELFERSPERDIVLWTAMINGYVQLRRFDEALSLFHAMQFEQVKPDKFTVVSLLTACAQLGDLDQGRRIHGYIDGNRIAVDAVVATALIEMYAKCGNVEKPLEIFSGLEEKDTALWTSMICGLAMNGKTSKALDLFSKMKRFGCKPDGITLVGVLSACSHGGLVEEGRRYFHSMEKMFHIQPQMEHYACMVDILSRAGLLDEAESLIESIPCKSAGIVAPLYGALLSACRIHGNTQMGEQVSVKLMGIDSSDSSVHSLLANIYSSINRWEDVTAVRRNMKALGVRKVPGCSKI